MLEQLFTAIILTSVVGAALTIILILIKPVTQKRFSSRWHYYMWLAVLILMVCPVRFGLPAETPPALSQAEQTQPEIIQTSSETETQNIQATVSENIDITQNAAKQTETFEHISSFAGIPENMLAPASRVWIIAAALLLAYKIISYIIFIIKIKKNSWEIPRSYEKNTTDIHCQPQYFLPPCDIYASIKNFTNRNISIRISRNLSSPLITGLFRPILLLPDIKMTEEQLNNILLHEMTHFKKHDILYKWFAAFVKSVHWFNPTIYFINRQIDMECEISCDLTATQDMSQEEKLSYINTILDLLSEANKKTVPLTTGMTGNMKILKRRFTMIKNKKEPGRLTRIISAVSAVLIVFCALFASGVSADEIFNNKYNINVINDGQKIELRHKPFVENNTVYLPLREMLNLENVDNDNITYDNGYVQFLIYSADYDGTRPDGSEFWINRVRVGSPYAYIRGHNYGSTENTELLAAPVIKNGTAYAPYDLFYKLHESYQEIFSTLQVTAENMKYPDSVISGILYENSDLNFKITLPLSWMDIAEPKFYAFDLGDSIQFVHRATYDKYKAGTLFYINRYLQILRDEEIGAVVPQQFLAYQGGCTYIMTTPSDVQYPIWTDRDEEDIPIAAEYEAMASDLDFIKNSFDNIIKITNDGDSQPPAESETDTMANPQYTVRTFFNAFEANDFDLMKSCCTTNGARFFDENSHNVFGMTECRLKNLYIDPLEYAKSSNDFNVRVTVDMKPAQNSVYAPDQTEATFYVCLLRRPDGRYLIHEFATGV